MADRHRRDAQGQDHPLSARGGPGRLDDDLGAQDAENSEGLARIHARRRTDPDYVRKHLSFDYSRVT
jgi:hypothetical protein